jgi:hypothetical protein
LPFQVFDQVWIQNNGAVLHVLTNNRHDESDRGMKASDRITGNGSVPGLVEIENGVTSC